MNAVDLKNAEAAKLDAQVVNRLKLTPAKIKTLVDGIRAIASQPEPIGQLLQRTELAEGLELEKTSCPIGVLLIIFESRPDCLPQISALAIRSGNGLLLKGGKEAEHSNAFLHKIIADTLASASAGRVSRDAIGLITNRADIPSLLQLDQYIDLVIPRGSGALVKFIKDNTRIPVMGHAEGVCHVFVDKAADADKAVAVVVDAKIDYPSACNAAETLLLHEDTVASGLADRVLRALRAAGVTLYGGPRAMQAGLADQAAKELNTEYGALGMTVELVSSTEHAVEHIHSHGSSHTECIITEDAAAAQLFLRAVDSACVFHNASTRFADGYRFGLGAEVGIATGRIHARGPVGVEGLLTSKWTLRSSAASGHTVGMFAGDKPAAVYTHVKKPIA